MNTCKNCGNTTNNPKFCSRSCSATFTNKTNPKRLLIDRICGNCGSKLQRKSHLDTSTVCKECKMAHTFARYDSYSIKDVTYSSHHRSSAFALIRARARKIAKDAGLVSCSICGYSTHVEICHIKSISSFTDDTLVSSVNSLDNLVALCPNHHWELDNGVIKI